jgi:RNA polymerase sigma-70 factor (ECF subfamily)
VKAEGPVDCRRPIHCAEDLIALQPALRRYALSLCRRADLADDLVQTAAERAFTARVARDPAVPLRPWVFRILRNAFVDDTRRSATRGETGDITDNPDLLSVDGARLTEDQLMLASARATMDALPAEQRDVIHLVCVEDLRRGDELSRDRRPSRHPNRHGDELALPRPRRRRQIAWTRTLGPE